MTEIADAQTSAAASPDPSQSASIVGDLRLHEFKSRIFGNKRFLRVWLPPGYDSPANKTVRYPALYLNDGQNLFEGATSFTGVEWQVDETVDRLIREKKIPPMIIVGIDNAQKERAKEYLPYVDDSYMPPVRKVMGKRYPDFLLKEVIPYIKRRYRTLSGPENTSLGGSSYGGLISLYTVVAQPGVFGRLLVESPSLYVKNQQILKESRKMKKWPARIYLAVGTRETNSDEWNALATNDVKSLEAILRKAGLGDDRLKVVIEDGAPHHESSWARRFPDALAFLFGR